MVQNGNFDYYRDSGYKKFTTLLVQKVPRDSTFANEGNFGGIFIFSCDILLFFDRFDRLLPE